MGNGRDKKGSGSKDSGTGDPNHVAQQPRSKAPGKETRSSKLRPRSDQDAVPRQERAAGTGAAAPRVRTLWDITHDPWMDAAHRGTPLPEPVDETAVQAHGNPETRAPAEVHRAAARGIADSGSALPYLEQLQKCFGTAHDLGGVRAHIGGAAAEANDAMGAEAYATGEDIVFRSQPDLHTAAHEAAHVVQQRAGVQLAGGVGQAGDAYEQHADAVAARVVAGQSAADLLGPAPGTSADPASGLQRQERAEDGGAPAPRGLTGMEYFDACLEAALRDTPPPGAAPGAAVQRQEGSAAAAAGQESPLARARRTLESSDIKQVEDFRPASDRERLAFIKALLDQVLVGPWDEAALVRIWTGFGDRVLEVANQQPKLWGDCIDRGAKLLELPVIAAVQRRFRTDVRALARDILRRNEQHTLAEMQALGISEGGDIDPASAPIPEDAQRDYLAELQVRANDLVAARHALAELRRVPVGFRPVPAKVGLHWVRVTFDPAKRPRVGPDAEAVPGSLRPAGTMRTWEEVKAHHDRLQGVIALLASGSPVLYAAASREDDAQLADMAAARPDEARQVMAANLRDLLANIRKTIPKIGGDLDDRELTVLHEQLFRGQRGPSGIDWTQPVHQSLAREVVGDYESAQFWTSLGLGTLAAAGFVVAELATMGSATFFLAAGVGLGAGGTLAGRSWERWDDLVTAANASAGQDGEVVSPDQVDAALTTAVVDSAFAFLDLIPATKAVRMVATAKHGAQTAAGQGIEQTLARGAGGIRRRHCARRRERGRTRSGRAPYARGGERGYRGERRARRRRGRQAPAPGGGDQLAGNRAALCGQEARRGGRAAGLRRVHERRPDLPASQQRER